MFDVGHVLFGSQNYHLDGPDSDKDYKVLLCPDAEDFYFYKKVEKNDVPEGLSRENYSPMDVRTFDRNLRAGNPNCLEMLWSKEYEDLYFGLEAYMDEARDMFEQGYLVMVFPQFFSAVKGVVFNSLSRYGVNRKSASRALFWKHFVERVGLHDFVVRDEFWSCGAARELRFDEAMDLPSLEDLEYGFRFLENWVLKKAEDAYSKLTENEKTKFNDMAAHLQKRMKRFVFSKLLVDVIKKYIKET